MSSHASLQKKHLPQTIEEESHVMETKQNRVRERKRFDTDFEDERNVHESRNTTLEAGKR